jgi:hypothetical protein
MTVPAGSTTVTVSVAQEVEAGVAAATMPTSAAERMTMLHLIITTLVLWTVEDSKDNFTEDYNHVMYR